MYAPDQHDIDPRNPANWKEPRLRFDVRNEHKAEVASFDDKDFASAFVFNNEVYVGRDLNVIEVDLETGDEVCVVAAEFDEDVLRYVEE